jgi:hypothetical protein
VYPENNSRVSPKIETASSGQSSWLQIQRSWVQFLALPDFLNGGGSGMGFTQPLDDK